MAIVRRVNLIRNPSFALDLAGWSVFGGASVSRIPSPFTTWRMRLTFPTAGAGVAGVGTTVTGLAVGTSYQVWVYVPAASGTTTVQFEAQGIATGAVVTTNVPFTKSGAFSFTATSTSAAIRIKSAVASTAGHFVDIDISTCEETQGALGDYPPFDGSYPGAYWQGPVGLSPSAFDYYDSDVGTNPMRIVEFDARPVSSFDFVLDRDSLDDANVALIESPRWYHVIEAETASIRRGRQDPDADIGEGSATITLRDYDGKYDPDNPATPLQVNGVPVMRAGMRVRVSVVINYLGALVAEPLFTGSLEDVEIDRTHEPFVTVSAVDDVAKLNSSDVAPMDPPQGYGQATLWRAAWMLSYAGIGFFDATFGANMNRLMLATSGGGNVGSQLRLAANCEGGKVFAQRDGLIHVGSHSDDFATSPVATFTDSEIVNLNDIEYDDIKTSTSIRTLINRCEVQRGNYSAPSEGESAPLDAAPSVTKQNDDSVALNKRVWSETIEAPLLSDAEAATLAAWRASRQSRSATRVTSISSSLAGQPAGARWAAFLDLGSVIRIKRFAFGRGIDDLYGVGGIEHEITDQNWTVTIYTEPLDITGLYADQPQPFFLDTSALDSTDILSSF